MVAVVVLCRIIAEDAFAHRCFENLPQRDHAVVDGLATELRVLILLGEIGLDLRPRDLAQLQAAERGLQALPQVDLVVAVGRRLDSRALALQPAIRDLGKGLVAGGALRASLDSGEGLVEYPLGLLLRRADRLCLTWVPSAVRYLISKTVPFVFVRLLMIVPRAMPTAFPLPSGRLAGLAPARRPLCACVLQPPLDIGTNESQRPFWASEADRWNAPLGSCRVDPGARDGEELADLGGLEKPVFDHGRHRPHRSRGHRGALARL